MINIDVGGGNFCGSTRLALQREERQERREEEGRGHLREKPSPPQNRRRLERQNGGMKAKGRQKKCKYDRQN